MSDDGRGVKKIEAEAKVAEKFRDEDIKVKCLEMVMAHGKDNDKGMPWNKARKLFTWVKWGNPDMEVK